MNPIQQITELWFGKAAWKSMTMYGLALLAVGEQVVMIFCPEAGSETWAGQPHATCAALVKAVDSLGIILTGVGLRRAIPNKPKTAEQ